MPELPDVEGFRRLIAAHAVGRRISDVEVRDEGVVRGRTAGEFRRRVQGRAFTEAERRGKWLLARTDGPTLVFHFGMTGSLVWGSVPSEPSNYDRVVFGIGSDTLAYRDQRKLRGIWLADDEDELQGVIGTQGPDALNLTGSQLAGRLGRRRTSLKVALMDQRVVAGLGNMLSDEVLWRARIHPARRFGELGCQERRRLDRCLQQVLRTSVRDGRIPRRSTWLSSQRSVADPRCPRGHGMLRTSRLAGRTSYWCPVCQPEGAPFTP